MQSIRITVLASYTPFIGEKNGLRTCPALPSARRWQQGKARGRRNPFFFDS